MDELLSNLNEVQAEAVEAVDSSLLILAGAGTGKTKTLTSRIAWLVKTGRARSTQILAVTFTNKAAQEMRERVIRHLGEGYALPWVGTFHSIGARILRRHGELIKLGSDFTILNTDDQKRVMKELFKQQNLDEKRHSVGLVLYHIERWKNLGLFCDELPAEELASPTHKLSARLWKNYQTRLRQLNAADFGDLITGCIAVFQQDSELLGRWQDRLRFILVDEYQDTNRAQHILLRQLAGAEPNICCVGDDDQSIYGWRGGGH